MSEHVHISPRAREAAERICRILRECPELGERSVAEIVQGAMDAREALELGRVGVGVGSRRTRTSGGK